MRHYERVSPADKAGGDIVGDGDYPTTIAALSGGAVAYNSRTPFGDILGTGFVGQTTYVSRRDASGTWSTKGVTPASRPDAVQIFLASTKVQFFSNDLSHAIVYGYDLPGATDDSPQRNNIYSEDTDSRALRTVSKTQVDQLFPFDFLTQTVWGMSDDGLHYAFVTSAQLLPDAAPGAQNVYQWDDGVLSVAGIRPDGRAAASGSDIYPINYRRDMSTDGSRLAFVAASPTDGPTQLYQRIDGRRTVWISEPEHVSDPSLNRIDPTNVVLQAITPNGRNVFFATDSSLVDADTNSGPDLYRWTDSADPSRDANLTLITNDGDFPPDNNGTGVVGVSDDGSRVYYQPGSGNLTLWNNGDVRVIAPWALRDNDPRYELAATASRPGLGRVTPDGDYLAFITDRTLNLDGVHGLTGDVTNGHRAMYVYSLRDDRLQCISCVPGGSTSDALVVPNVTTGPATVTQFGIRPNFLSNDGHVFFSTNEGLLPQDNNHLSDAYEYDPSSGSLSLLSTGSGSSPAAFADASADGSDVFILTRHRLVGEDDDDLVDMYDARVGPPLLKSVTGTPPCEGESCQPPATGAPADAALGSLTLDQEQGNRTSSKAFVVRARAVVHGSAGTLRVRFLTPGKLVWRGAGLRPASVKHGRAGTYRLRLRLNKTGRARLARNGTYVTNVRLTFTGSGGTRVSGVTRVTFKVAAKKGR